MSEQSFQVGVKALIKNTTGQLLCIHDTEHDRWDIPGGRIDVDEDIVDCLNRELREEIGASAQHMELCTSTISRIMLPQAPDHRLLLMIYEVQISDDPFANELNTELMWLPGAQLAEKITNKYSTEFCEWLGAQ